MSAVPAATAAAPRPPDRPRFGVFARMREVFALVFVGRPGVFLGLGPLTTVAVAAFGSAIAWLVAAASGRTDGMGGDGPIWLSALVAPSLVLGVLVGAGVMVMAGCDGREGVRRRFGVYFGRTLRRLPIAAPIGLLVLVAILLGGSVFGPFGLWVAATFSAVPPALLWEDARWGALRRSRELTRGYRWSIAGLLLLILLVPIVLYVVAAAIGAPQAPPALKTLSAIPGVLATLLTVPLFSAASVVVHARLRALEGATDADTLRAVFA